MVVLTPKVGLEFSNSKYFPIQISVWNEQGEKHKETSVLAVAVAVAEMLQTGNGMGCCVFAFGEKTWEGRLLLL
ncbi:hypothetical protein V6N11_005441 [Hibiscus sabdariffa]|uniref:Uncharacterized protein n=1 Tax=Hibiscus sabdariffa TaxID=183260 RepID=A0ABR2RMX1_9ROSI